MGTTSNTGVSRKHIDEEVAEDTDSWSESTETDDSSYIDSSYREPTPWLEDRCKPGSRSGSENSMENETEVAVEDSTVPVGSTDPLATSKLGAPGTCTYSDVPAVDSPNNNIISLPMKSRRGEKISHDISPPLSPSDDTEGNNVPVLVCAATSSADRNPALALSLPPSKSILRKQNMDAKDATNLKRKRKNPSDGLPNQKQKKPKVTAEPKKVPACKSCYHKHIGCERLTESEPCRACEKRKQPCERNDVRIVKGEKTVVKEEPAPGESSQETEAIYQEGSLEDSTEATSSVRVVSVAESDEGEDLELCGQEIQAEAVAASVRPEQNHERDEGQGLGRDSSEGGVEADAPAKTGTDKYGEMTDIEKEAVDILLGMKTAEVALLDAKTSDFYFETIKGILSEGVENSEKREAGLKMLDKLRWQLTWLSGCGHQSSASLPLDG
ncbi:hypothetical protein TWF481_000217 [Arthrobotrys musiformis]|uniref:Zn(2)-C6 fungal-type domain-containing protein n=1 Tax=Arthrobotrys musiformis TaxID=47236 RepID=A0AAV9WM39_9PEZI